MLIEACSSGFVGGTMGKKSKKPTIIKKRRQQPGGVVSAGIRVRGPSVSAETVRADIDRVAEELARNKKI